MMSQFEFLMLLIKITSLLATAWLADKLLNRANPRWRVWLWRFTAVATVALVGLLCCPDNLRINIPVAVEWEPAVSAKSEIQVEDDVQIRPIEMHEDALPASSIQDVSLVAADIIGPEANSELVPTSYPVGLLAAAVWIAGICFLGLRELLGQFRVRRILRGADQAPEEVAQRLNKFASTNKWIPNVAIATSIHSPAIVGLIRPTILLPSTLIETGTETDFQGSDIDAALAHEITHLNHHDLLWDHVFRFLTAMMWINPLVWIASSRHRIAFENVCDVVTADLLGDRIGYRASLARIAIQANGPAIPLGLTMARSSNIVSRIRLLAQTRSAHRLERASIVASIFAAILIGVAGISTAAFVASAPESKQQEQEKQEQEKLKRTPSLIVSVVAAEDDEPIPDAQITIRLAGKGVQVNNTFKSNPDGKFEFAYPPFPETARLIVEVRTPGRVPYYFYGGQQSTPFTVPDKKKFRLQRGKVIRGILRDEDGTAIAGANIDISVPATESVGEIHFRMHAAVSDDDGRWKFDSVPKSLDGIWLRVDHSEYLNNSFSLLDQPIASYVLKRGIVVRGSVVDESGAPVGGAVAKLGQDMWGSGKPSATTDENGDFELKGVANESSMLTITAPNHAPKIKKYVPSAQGTVELNFKLEKGNTTRFRVVDSKGHPIPGATVIADGWQQARTIAWRTTTDADGNASWTAAPSDEVYFHVGKSGYVYSRGVKAIAGDKVHIIQLQTPTLIFGNVADATTGEKVEKFEVEVGRELENIGLRWGRRDREDATQGYYEFTMHEASTSLQVRITADGYEPWTSNSFLTKDRVEISAKLKKGIALHGKVLTPAHQPAKGVQVNLALPEPNFRFSDNFRASGSSGNTTTNRFGKFRLYARGKVHEDKNGALIFVSPDGFAEVPLKELESNRTITLEAWSRLEFAVTEQGQPVADTRVEFLPFNAADVEIRKNPNIWAYGMEGKTHVNGKLILKRVVPMSGIVVRKLDQILPNGSSFSFHSHSHSIRTDPGKTHKVNFGDVGASVVGQIDVSDLALEGDENMKAAWPSSVPGEIVTMDTKWSDPKHRSYRFLVDADGRFECHGILPEKYQMKIQLNALSGSGTTGHGKRIGYAERLFDVSNEQAAELFSIDFGTIKARPVE